MSISVKPLGAGQEVGRSCVIVKIKDLRIMFDCGVHMAYNDNRKFPDFRKIIENEDKYKRKIPSDSKSGLEKEDSIYKNLKSDYINYSEVIDLIIITHFHLDHCAALPYFLKKYNFNGRVYMTSPTKTLYKF